VLPILVRSEDFVVLDKPPGLPVHPGPRGGPSVEDWFPLLSRRREGPWLVHRLDADTAGCLVVALRKAALLEAQAAFAAGRAGKTYWAVVRGRPAQDSGRVAARLLRRSTKAGWRMEADPKGQDAATDWVLRGVAEGGGEGIAWLELHPRTGRTHQIRVHCALLGCPILGDPIYGDGAGTTGFANASALHLLARGIALPLTPPLAATAPAPPHMRAALAACGATEADLLPAPAAPDMLRAPPTQGDDP
jgi:tRNA pseudouridine32 synthase/23S rRNA pseudouridine746 synthase